MWVVRNKGVAKILPRVLVGPACHSPKWGKSEPVARVGGASRGKVSMFKLK